MFALFFTKLAESAITPNGPVPIRYYSVIKLQHAKTGLMLSSIELNYQTGSTQQLVRGVNKTKYSRAETYWTVLPLENSTIHQGEIVKCGDKLRFKHTVTGKNLHSHAIAAQLEKGYEISAFDGSDHGDIWEIQCKNTDVMIGENVKLFHLDTQYYLNANATGLYIPELMGEHEIYGSETPDDTEWFVRYGIFVSK